ncbi:MBL fold metallo-hydrolase [Metabacillus litoralis]|uniref:MBL fold metallo-hydrolase n=1 Tax=Metabacillus litoralis TaxID=152268 RepID=UPI001E2FA85D|nr:MBL fold metallo-hydrolase [Metabacillus litoralis]UHA59513.1 MBL fold metallo-hydrolase [Metabacillus litoralis]
MALTKKINDRITIIDTMDLGMQGRTSCYVLQDEKQVVLFEPSASPSVPHILEGLNELNIPFESIAYIIVTHIHLDHAGGAGLLLEKCPNAKLIVHPKGARHMIDPSRLIAGAKAVYGESFDRLFHPVLPIAEDRIIIKKHLDTLELSNHCTLTFYDSPGHANHHFSIHDSVSNGIFTGDTIGVFYGVLPENNKEFYLPSTSPNQFDPEAMLHSAKMIENLNVSSIYFSHYGVSKNPTQVINELRKWLPLFLKTAQQTLTNNSFESIEQANKQVYIELQNLVSQVLAEQKATLSNDVHDMVLLDLSVCAQGLVDYFYKLEQKRKNVRGI